MQQNPNQSGTQERTGTPNSFIVIICASVSTIIPALNCAISSEEIFSSSIRTGIRCCTFTKFPAELSVGTREYFDPVASEIAVTSPLKIFPGNASTLTRTC